MEAVNLYFKIRLFILAVFVAVIALAILLTIASVVKETICSKIKKREDK